MNDQHFRFTDRRAAKTLAVAEHLVDAYVAARSGLRELGILRSDRSLQADFAEWIAAKRLRLKLNRNSVEKDHDAVDDNNRRYQIKSRLVDKLSDRTSFDSQHRDSAFHFLIAVFFSRRFEVLGILRVPRATVQAHSTKGRFRWNRACANDPGIEWLFPRDGKTLTTSARDVAAKNGKAEKLTATERLKRFGPVRTIARFIKVSKTRRRVVFKECKHKGGTVGLGSRKTARCRRCRSS